MSYPTEQREILLLAMLRHQLCEAPRQRELVADHLVRMDGDGPGVDRPRQRIAVAVDDVAALRDVGGQPLLAPGMVAEGGEIEDSQRDDGDDAGIDQHAEHQPLVHDGEQLPALADQSEPLGPWRDESGRRCVHRSAAVSLELPECFAGSGASGSTFAIRTGFVTGLCRNDRAAYPRISWPRRSVFVALSRAGRPRGPASPRTSLGPA